jgi:hypothetical protein
MPVKKDDDCYEAGTLIIDMGKLGIITRVLKSGALQTEFSLIKWRINYEIYYVDGDVQIIGNETFDRLVQKGVITLLQ